MLDSHVVPYEDKVPLVVYGDGPPPREVGRVVEHGAQHAGHGAPEERREVVQEHLRSGGKNNNEKKTRQKLRFFFLGAKNKK